MSDDRFRLDPNTRLPRSIFEQPAPSPVARGGTTLAAPRDTIAPRPGLGHHAPVKHRVDDTVRERAHAAHTIQEGAERATHALARAAARKPASRLTRGLDTAHRVAGHPVARGIGKLALGVGVALDAYQGWREYPSDSALHKTRAAGGYAAIGYFMSRLPPLAFADIPLDGAISNTVKRAGQGLLVADHALVGRDPEAAKIYDDRVQRGDYGSHFQAGSRAINRLLP